MKLEVRMVGTVFTAVLAAVVVTLAPARAASVDCSKATTTVEKAICGDPQLGAADEAMAQAYARLRHHLDPSAASTLLSDQIAWIQHRGTSCIGSGISACIMTEDTDRRLFLQNPAARSLVTHVGRDATWDGDSSACNDAADGSVCLAEVIHKAGAAEAATAFAFHQHDDAYLQKILSSGPVQVGLETRVAGGNNPDAYVLLNGTPFIQDLDRYLLVSDSINADVSKRYPDAFVSSRSPQFVGQRLNDDGGQELTFRATVAKCEACQPLAYVTEVASVSSSGRVTGVRYTLGPPSSDGSSAPSRDSGSTSSGANFDKLNIIISDGMGEDSQIPVGIVRKCMANARFSTGDKMPREVTEGENLLGHLVLQTHYIDENGSRKTLRVVFTPDGNGNAKLYYIGGLFDHDTDKTAMIGDLLELVELCKRPG